MRTWVTGGNPVAKLREQYVRRYNNALVTRWVAGGLAGRLAGRICAFLSAHFPLSLTLSLSLFGYRRIRMFSWIFWASGLERAQYEIRSWRRHPSTLLSLFTVTYTRIHVYTYACLCLTLSISLSLFRTRAHQSFTDNAIMRLLSCFDVSGLSRKFPADHFVGMKRKRLTL